MTETSYINPFSSEAKKIVSKLGNINNLNKPDTTLKSIIEMTRNQELKKELPETIKQLALKKYEWALNRKLKDYDHREYQYLFNPELYEYDVVSFYLLCQIIAMEYGSDSYEANEVLQMQHDLITQRLEKIAVDTPELLSVILNELTDTSNLYWYDIKEILQIGNIEFNKLLLVNGRIIIEYDDFYEQFADKIEGRRPHDIYQIVAGNFIKTRLITSYITYYMKEYMKNVDEMSKKQVEPNPLMKQAAEEIRKIQVKTDEIKYKNQPKGSFSDDKPTPYNPEAFPPCVKECIKGIKSGGRNDAIVLFLTPFASYARLYPGIFSQKKQVKITDVDPSLNITHDQVIPLIYDAAQSCRPPLFKDQPQEKININAKLGFGMHDELKREYEGETHWYTPMSCDKIKLHMPHICKPNKDCVKIGNPLTYYNRMRKIKQKGGQ
ncbi:DNA primase [uncultured Methanosphaera sp.]|uniref:DNA primase n=1 Tax=uncultured Methanosphaera sp. TaxID=262501 RepID=UPI002804313E|nr:DNA primase [uncultured Methanosphaera sp.]